MICLVSVTQILCGYMYVGFKTCRQFLWYWIPPGIDSKSLGFCWKNIWFQSKNDIGKSLGFSSPKFLLYRYHSVFGSHQSSLTDSFLVQFVPIHLFKANCTVNSEHTTIFCFALLQGSYVFNSGLFTLAIVHQCTLFFVVQLIKSAAILKLKTVASIKLLCSFICFWNCHYLCSCHTVNEHVVL